MAAKKQTKKTQKNTKKGQDGFSFKINMSPESKSLTIRAIGIGLLIFVIFSLVASISFMSTW